MTLTVKYEGQGCKVPLLQYRAPQATPWTSRSHFQGRGNDTIKFLGQLIQMFQNPSAAKFDLKQVFGWMLQALDRCPVKQWLCSDCPLRDHLTSPLMSVSSTVDLANQHVLPFPHCVNRHQTQHCLVEQQTSVCLPGGTDSVP